MRDVDLLGDPIERQGVDDGEWPRRYAELVDTLIEEIHRQGVNLLPGRDRGLACALVSRLCQQFGGNFWYVPKADALARIERNARIWAEHDGTSDGRCGVRALARRYGLSDQAVWAILREERARHLARVQPELSGLEMG